MASSITETGRVSAEGKLHLPMERLSQFFARHKGEKVLIKIDILTKGTSEAMRGYYWNYIIPTIRKAFYDTGNRMSISETDEFLRELPKSVCWKDDECRSFRDLTKDEQIEFIEFLRQYAAENLYVFIEDPKTL